MTLPLRAFAFYAFLANKTHKLPNVIMEIHAVYDRTVSVSVLLSMPYRNSKEHSCLEPPGSTLSGGRKDVDLKSKYPC
jgi:hypothetical protein